MPASAAGSRRWWGRSWRRWATVSRCSASRTCRRSRRAADALPDRESAVHGRRTVTSVSRLDGDERVAEIARMMGGAAAGEKAMESARELLDAVGGERRKRKAKVAERRRSESAKADRRKPTVMKYFIETYGCQMNVHDSERMAGLLEQSGYDRAESDARRRPRRHQHLQRARERRGQALHAARRDQGDGRASSAAIRSSPSPAASRSRKASKLIERSPAHRRRRRHAAREDAADAGRTQALQRAAADGVDALRVDRSRSTTRTTSRRFRSA